MSDNNPGNLDKPAGPLQHWAANFDPYAMVKPKTEEDMIALAKEAIAELKNLNQLLDDAFPEL